MKLKIGLIAYTNLFPIFYTLRKEFDCSDYEFVEGVPSALNKKIRSGEIDVSPSSSIEYLRNPAYYTLIPDHSVSSKGPVGSILLFSKRPIEALGGLSVAVSSQSETSVALLKIILKKFYDLECRLLPSSEPVGKAMRSHEAYLLIGDDALAEALKWPKLQIYDLGDIWYRNTGLPFTFALWIAKKGCCAEKDGLFARFRADLDRAKRSALKNLRAIASESPMRDALSEEDLVSYWQGISYDLGGEHEKGLDLFRRYAGDLGLL